MKLHVMRVLNETGDKVYNWDPANPTTVKEAKSVFDQLIRGQFLAYSLKPSGATNNMDSFDSAEEEIIMTPQLTVG